MEDKTQIKAIKYGSGPALILAGPGSGKTTVLTHHIKHLIETGVSPDKILVITFTRKAAFEMKSRFTNLCPQTAAQTTFGTFHSIFYKIIKAFDKTEKRLVSSDDRINYISYLASDHASAEYYDHHISFYKSLSDKTLFRFVNDTEKEEFLKVYDAYNDWLKSEGMIDYDDIICECNELLKRNKEAVKYLNDKFSHICVDEFQDINNIQYETLKLMAGKRGIIYAVGDEDQSIYGFRGATPDIMKQFIKDYDNTAVINLAKNYRSYQEISDFSYKVISKNPGRLNEYAPDCIKSDNKKHVQMVISKSREESIRALIRDCYCRNDKSDAVLLRTNKEVAEYRRILLNTSEDEDAFKAGIIEDFLCYIEYILTRNIQALKIIINIPARGIPGSLLKDAESLEHLKKKVAGTRKADIIYVFENKLNVLKGLNPFSFAMYLKNIVGLYEYHREKSGLIKKEIIDNIYEEIIEVAGTCADLGSFKAELESMKPSVIPKTSNDKVTITTFHQAKGLEWDRVFIPDAIEGKIPASMSVSECKVEEERRLFYVALTRARENLYIYTIKNEESGGSLPSRFIEEFIS